MNAPADKPAERASDAGFSLVELAVYLAILGVLATVVAFGLHGIIEDGETSACESEQQAVGRAVESWFANNRGDSVPPTGMGPDRYEMTLVDAGFIRSASTDFDLSRDGSLSPAVGSHC